MRNWKGAAMSLLLIAGLMAGCGKADGTKAAITVNGDTLSMGTAALQLRYQQAMVTNTMQMYGLVGDGQSLWSQEMAEDEEGNKQTYGDSTKETVKESIVEMLLLKAHAEEYKVTVPAEIEEAAQTAATNFYEKNKEALAKLGTTQDNIKELLMLSTYPDLMYDPMTADVDTEVSDEEAKQSTIGYARIAKPQEDAEAADTEDAAAETEEAEETADPKALMEDYLKALKDADDPAAADMGTMAADISEDIFASTYSYGSDNASMAEEVMEAAKDLKDGEVYDGVIETSDGYYYVVRMNAVFDKEATEAQKQSIGEGRKRDAYNELLSGWKEKAEITVSDDWTALTLSDSDNWIVKAS